MFSNSAQGNLSSGGPTIIVVRANAGEVGMMTERKPGVPWVHGRGSAGGGELAQGSLPQAEPWLGLQLNLSHGEGKEVYAASVTAKS